MSIVPKIELLIRDFSKIQKGLCQALVEKYEVEEDSIMSSLPLSGSISLDDSFWEFQRHGKGVRFCSIPDEEVIDVHVGLVSCMDGLDAWRFLEYLESKKISEIQCEDRKFNISSEKELINIFNSLVKKEFLKKHSKNQNLYQVR